MLPRFPVIGASGGKNSRAGWTKKAANFGLNDAHSDLPSHTINRFLAWKDLRSLCRPARHLGNHVAPHVEKRGAADVQL